MYVFIIYWEQYSNVTTYVLLSPGRQVIKTHNLLKTSLGQISYSERERRERDKQGGPASLKITIQSVYAFDAKLDPQKASRPGDNAKHCGTLISDEIKLRVNVSASEKESGMVIFAVHIFPSTDAGNAREITIISSCQIFCCFKTPP
jgi:hypothetical protein